MKKIPLSEPMGGSCSCCVHGKQCHEFMKTIDNVKLIFRCPLVAEVEDEVEYVGPWYESCFDENIEEE